MPWQEIHHADAAQMTHAVAALMAQDIALAVAARGHAVLALAGGRTPFPAYRYLATQALPWDKVTLLATDERWVDEDDPARNERELKDAFAPALGVRWLTLVPPNPGAEPSAAHALAQLGPLNAPLDLVILGMGLDGHFASLFPGAAELGRGLDRENADAALVVHPLELPKEAPYPRVSLTLQRLLNSRRRLLLISGVNKLNVLSRGKGPVSPQLLPIRACLTDALNPIEIHWSP